MAMTRLHSTWPGLFLALAVALFMGCATDAPVTDADAGDADTSADADAGDTDTESTDDLVLVSLELPGMT
jgi:hypothetical protein